MRVTTDLVMKQRRRRRPAGMRGEDLKPRVNSLLRRVGPESTGESTGPVRGCWWSSKPLPFSETKTVARPARLADAVPCCRPPRRRSDRAIAPRLQIYNAPTDSIAARPHRIIHQCERRAAPQDGPPRAAPDEPQCPERISNFS
jgi:hypothetical protein